MFDFVSLVLERAGGRGAGREGSGCRGGAVRGAAGAVRGADRGLRAEPTREAFRGAGVGLLQGKGAREGTVVPRIALG